MILALRAGDLAEGLRCVNRAFVDLSTPLYLRVEWESPMLWHRHQSGPCLGLVPFGGRQRRGAPAGSSIRNSCAPFGGLVQLSG